MKVTRYLLVSALVLATAFRLDASSSGRDLRMSDHLSHLDVRAFAQDSFDNIWIATLGGLNRYNGYEYEHFLHDASDSTSLSHDFVFSLLMDEDDVMWVGTANGVDRFDIKTGVFVHAKGLPATSFSLYKDSAGNLWTATPIGAGLVDREGLTVTFDERRGPVNCFWEDGYHRLWMGVDDGFRLRGSDAAVTLPGGRKVLCQYADRQGRWWLGTDSGIIIHDPATGSMQEIQKLFPDLQELENCQINFISEVAPYNLLIGTATEGVFSCDIIAQKGARNSPVSFNPGNSAELNACFVDRRGSVWVGTYDKGFILAGTRSDVFNRDPAMFALNGKFVTRVVAASSGGLWVATRYDGLYRYASKGKLEFIDISSVVPGGGDLLEIVYEDSAGNLWLAFESELVVVRVRGSRAELLGRVAVDHVRVVREDDEGTVWIGAWGGLYSIRKGRGFSVTAENENTRNVSDILSMEDGTILYSSYGVGIFGMKDGKVERLRYASGDEDILENCITMFADDSGRLWFGSYGNGLLCHGDGIHFRLGFADGLPDGNVLSVRADLSGDVWVSTLHGIARLDMNEKGEKPGVQVFSSDQYHEKAGCLSNEGYLAFGGNHGITCFDPAELSEVHTDPKVHIEDLRIDNRSIDNSTYASVIDIDHGNRTFSVDWAGTDFFSGNNLRYSYRLKGFDDEWNDAGTFRRASWSKLRRGRYVFEVVAIGDDGKRSTPCSLRINIHAAPWFSWWAWTLYALIVVSIVSLILRLSLNSRKMQLQAEAERREKIREREMFDMKSTFFTNVSHELRTPLTLISAPLEKLSSLPGQNAESRELLDSMQRNMSRLMMLLNQLMDFSKMENGVLALRVCWADLPETLDKIKESFGYLAEKKGITLGISSEVPYISMWLDCDKVEKIMDNLLSNALKHTPSGGKVDILVSMHPDPGAYGLGDGDYVEVAVEDNGTGIPADKLGELFVRYRIIDGPGGRHPDYSDNGIGLHYTKNLVETHHGRIKAALRPEGGMRFSFVLPLGDVYLQSEKASDIMPEDVGKARSELRGTAASDGRKCVMVVEDNVELREFIAGLLAPEYRVIVAADGLQAWNMLHSESPEVLVSDVLMPGLTGYELCSRIKQSPSLCHIQVVLLTAKTTPEDQEEGLENGADVYICKPFHVNFLLKTVANLIHNKEVLQRYFSEPFSGEESLTEVELPYADQEFLQRLGEVMQQHMSDAAFDIDGFAREMGCSRTSFYIRVKTLTGMAPNDFIRNIRFKYAAEGIRNGVPLAEIAEQAGFGSYSYFSKAFKKHFGVSPKAYQTSGQ